MKTNLKTCLIILLSILALSSCSTDKTMIAKGVNLNKYEYASIVKGQTIHGTETDIEIEPGIYDAIESTRLKMVGERRVNDLTTEQKERIVLVKYVATSSEEKSTLSVSFEDYMTGKTVASCRSSNSTAWTRQRDVDRAIKKLAKRIEKSGENNLKTQQNEEFFIVLFMLDPKYNDSYFKLIPEGEPISENSHRAEQAELYAR